MAVRRESVLLEVEGNFQRQILEDATAVEALRRSLKGLSGQSVQTSRSSQGLQRDIENTGKSAKKAEKELDSYTGRLGLLASAIAAVAPGIAPVGAVGVAGLAGVANDAGMAATAVGSLVLALHGVMPALKAVNKAALEPTAANLQAASLAMQQLSPDARKFVVELQSMEPLLHKIQASAASGWFPGLAEALHNLRPVAPIIEKIFHDVGVMGGNLAAKGAAALAGPQWADFFKFIDTEAPKAMAAMGHVVGSLAHGLAKLWESFAPLSNGFNNWLVDVAKGFDSWATGLSQTQGFHDFIAYVDQNGPKVAAAVGAIADAVLKIVEASAPLGGPTLDAIRLLAKLLGVIAASPLGTPILLLVQMAGVARLASTAVGSLTNAYKDLVVAEAEAGAGAATAASKGAGIKAAGVPIAAAAFNAYQNFQDAKSGSQSGVNAAARSVIPFFSTAQDAAKHFGLALPGLTTSVFGLGQVTSKTNKSLSTYSSATRAAAQKTASLRAANKDTADSFVNLSQAMKKPTLSLDHLISRWRSQAAAEAELGKNIATAVAKGANPAALTQIINQLGPQAGLAIKQLARGGKKDIADLNAAFHTGQHAATVYNGALNTLTQTMLGIPHTVNAKVVVDGVDRAISGIAALRQRLSNPIVQSVQVQYHGKNVTVNPTAGGPGLNPLLPGGKPSSGSGKHGADGTTVPKTGLPYADRHLYWLADGEEVISNRHGQADRHRALLKAINANRMASGGTAGRSSSTGSSTVRHVIEVKVIGGELDLTRARHQIRAIANEVSRDQIDQDHAFQARG